MSRKYVIEVTDQNFDEVVLQSDVPVVVDFWAPWCEPCRALAPIFENIAKTFREETEEQFPGKVLVRFVKLNVDESPLTAERFRVLAIPMVGIFNNGVLIDEGVGGEEGPDVIRRLIDSLS